MSSTRRTPPISIRLLDVDETIALRKMVLRPDLTLAKARAPYAGPEKSCHIGLFSAGMLVSIASFIEKPHRRWPENGQWMLRGMATHPAARCKGYGSQLLRYGIHHLQQFNPRFIWCSARLKALPFYRRAGFQPAGDVTTNPKGEPRQLLQRRFKPANDVWHM